MHINVSKKHIVELLIWCFVIGEIRSIAINGYSIVTIVETFFDNYKLVDVIGYGGVINIIIDYIIIPPSLFLAYKYIKK